LNIRNTIVDTFANGYRAISGNRTQCTIRSSLLPGPFPLGAIDSGGNLLNANPLFVDTANNNCSLMPLSPAINTGNNSLHDPTIFTDLAGLGRISGGTIDMGAFEHQFGIGVAPLSLIPDNIKVYPNPAANTVTFSYDAPNTTGNLLLTVNNIFGQTIQQFPLTSKAGQLQWNTSTLADGLYIYTLTDQNNVLQIGKLVISK